MNRSIEVYWRRGPAAGYADVFPVDEFAKPVVGAARSHLVRGPRGGQHVARFALTVGSLDAVLDYTAFSRYNERHGMERGTMRFRFADPKRTRVQSLWWDNEVVELDDAAVTTVLSKKPASPGELAVRAQRTDAKVLLRPGQIEFRRKLDLMYGAKCCISGCTVPWALEAAHIVPYKDSLSDSPSNGLLLRRDLHSLFDAGHLAVHPKSKEVHFSAEAQGWGDYAALHRTVILPRPQPGFEKEAPAPATLRVQWRRFIGDHTQS